MKANEVFLYFKVIIMKTNLLSYDKFNKTDF